MNNLDRALGPGQIQQYGGNEVLVDEVGTVELSIDDLKALAVSRRDSGALPGAQLHA
jgi:hypothetical protein